MTKSTPKACYSAKKVFNTVCILHKSRVCIFTLHGQRNEIAQERLTGFGNVL